MKEIDNKLTQKFDEYPSFGVLKGVKVFVTGTNIAGPFAGCLMAEMGAKVLQAEAPTIACQTRGTLAWSQNHSNENSITINSATFGGIRIAASEEEMHRGIGNQRVNKARPSSVCTLFDLFLQGRLLKGEYNALLQRLLCGTTTGANKLKAGLPAEIVIGHKTGSSDRTAEGIRIADNDAGYVLLPDGRRYCIAVFVTESEENDAANAAIAAAVSRAAYEYFSSE